MKEKQEIVRFLIGGGCAVFTDYGMYQMLMNFFGLNQPEAKAASFLCGSIVGFVINKLWTFESKEFQKSEIVKYILLYSCTAGINAMINQTVLRFFPIELLGFLTATGVSTILNYLGQKYFVFHVGGRR